jgi:diacylglycerol kinase (ATP)
MTDPFQRPQGMLAVFAAAWHGLLHTVAVQRNMKIHWISGFMVMLVGMALDFDLTTRAALFFCVFIILFAEILNSALEAFVDLHMQQYHYQAKLAKDAAAAGVLTLAAAVVILFADIIVRYNREQILASGENIVRTLGFGLPLVGLMWMLLFANTARWIKHAALIAGLGLLAPLILRSRDPFFSLTAGGFFLVAYRARIKHPKGLR